MNKKKLDALAWTLYAGGGTHDTSDVISTIDDLFSELELSDDDKEAVADKVSDIADTIRAKAHAKWERAFG